MPADTKGPATIFDIAERAGVSVTTVSRTLNGRSDVSARTADKVRRVIEELSYQPKASARRLASGRSMVLGVLPHPSSADLGSVIYEYITGIVEGAEVADYSVTILPRTIDERRLQQLSLSGQFDGVVLLQVQTHDWRVAALRESTLPFVLIGRTEDTTGISYVDVDLVSASHDLVRKLVAEGHKNIVFIGNSLTRRVRRFSASLLHEGYVAGMAEHALTPEMLDCEFSIDGVSEAIARALEAMPDTTCFVVGGHVAMAQILRRLSDWGIKVPERASIASILPGSVAEMITPQTTTIDLPGRELGREAAQSLIHRIGRPDAPPTQKLLSPRIIWRESVRSLRAGGAT
jgi:DNA-binding LacI/PurR family transcriptional regulator